MPSLMRALVPPAVAALVAGCGGTTIDGDALENEIVADAEREGLILDGAECPSPEADGGDTFECTVTVKGDDTPLEIVQRNDEGNVQYELGPLLATGTGRDVGSDEAAVRFVIDAVNRDTTAICDYATRAFRRELARDRSCAKAALAKYDDGLLVDYEVSILGDEAAASAGARTVALERRRDGSWLITDVR